MDLSVSPAIFQIIETITKVGKKGRIHLVFLTAAKWSLTRVHAGRMEILKMFLQIPKTRIPGRNGAVTTDRLLKAVSSAHFLITP